MSIATKCQQILQCKADIKAAIEGQGVTVGNASLSQYARLISQIHEQTMTIVNITESISTLSCELETLYNINSSVGTLAITLPSVTGSAVKTIVLAFTTSSSPSITITSSNSEDVHFYDSYEIEASTTYEVNCMWNGSAWVIGASKINTSS